MKRRFFIVAILALAFLLPAANCCYADGDDTSEIPDEQKPIILSAKEAQAVADLQTLHDVCIVYRDTTSGFPEALGILLEGNSPSLSKELGNGENPKIGYHYYYAYIDRDKYEIYAESNLPRRTFYIDETGIVRLGDKSGQPVFESQ